MIKNIIYLITVMVILSACSPNEELSANSVVDSNAVMQNKTELDQWITETFSQPYGIEVEYRWSRNKERIDTYTHYPPDVANVKQVLQTIKSLWIDIYTDADFGGSKYMAGKSPVKIYMYGGRNVDANGVELLYNPGLTTSEMCLYNVNEFDPTDEQKVLELMRVVHHQFAKRLAELYPYNRDKFLAFSKERYYSDAVEVLENRNSYNIHNPFANKNGFISLPAMLSASDDFAEIVSAMLTHNSKEIALAVRIVATPLSNSIPAGDRELSAKIDFVTDYFEKELKIDLKRLQQQSSKRIKTFLNP